MNFDHCFLPRFRRRKKKKSFKPHSSSALSSFVRCSELEVLARLPATGLMERSGGAPPKDAPIDWPEISTKRHQQQQQQQRHHQPPCVVQQLANKDGTLFLIPDALSETECRSLIRAVEDAGGFDRQGSRGPAKGEALRDCGRVSRRGPAEEALVARLWKRLSAAILSALPPRDAERAVGLNPHVRMYAYAPGQRFSRHYDDSEAVERGRTATGYTLLLYLSTLRGAAPGGETKFYSDGGKLVASVAPVAGTALLHRHGASCLLHEGAKVERAPAGSGGENVKYVFRSDVVFECAWWS